MGRTELYENRRPRRPPPSAAPLPGVAAAQADAIRPRKPASRGPKRLNLMSVS